MVAVLPLLAGRAGDSPLAWHAGQPIRVAQALADAQALAARLPEADALVNLCVDRYHFAVAFVAGLLRGQTSLLPPNAMPATLSALQGDGRRLVAIGDDDALTVPQGLALLRMDARHAPVGGEEAPPLGWPAPQAAACLLTSGSTGTPQPCGKSWGMLVANVDAAAKRLAEVLERPSLQGLALVTTVPPQHSYGFESSVLLGLLGGASFDTGRPFFPADIARALADLPRPRALVTTPFHLKTLLLAGLELPKVDLVLCATAPLSPQLAAQAERALGGPLLEIYGCTEAGQVATRRTVQGETWTTFGDLRVHAEAAARASADGQRFIVQGGHVETPTPLADVLELDDARHFRLLGRGNDLIKVAGRRSSLAHLNYHLNSIDGVVDGAFWLPDDEPDAVVRPVAFVVAPALPAAHIVAALRERLEPVFVPRRIVKVAALPREATGKLTLHTLQAFARVRLRVGGPDEAHAP